MARVLRQVATFLLAVRFAFVFASLSLTPRKITASLIWEETAGGGTFLLTVRLVLVFAFLPLAPRKIGARQFPVVRAW